jgi:hypothetical protein
MIHKKTKKLISFAIVFLSALFLCILIPACTSQQNFAKNVDSSKTSLDPALGTNLSSVVDWSTQLAFIDAFKASRAWIPQSEGVWDTGEAQKLDLDENGWLKSLPTDGSVKYTSVGTLLLREIGGRYPGGQYLVLYDGEGTLEYEFDAKKDESASTSGRDVIDVTPSEAGISLKITATDPNNNGNYLRNIRVIPAEWEDKEEEEIFNPEFIEKVQNFEALRFMDWMAINDSLQQDWSDRPTPESARYSVNGVPVELMVELANRTKTDPWFCLPHLATDEYVREFAEYVKDNLDSELKVYVEYSNEVWNGQFAQSRWANEQGKAQLKTNTPDGVKGVDWYSKRTTEITQIWDRVFDEDKKRVIGVMAAQAGNVWIAQQELSYKWTSQPRSHGDYGIDAIAIAPYFAHYLGSPEYQPQALAWTTEADGGLGNLFEELNQGGILDNSPQGGALQQAYSWIEQHAKLAQQENLQLLAYEGGQHLVANGGGENNDAIAKLFVEANRDSRMGNVYRDYLQKWFELGGDLFVNFSDISRPSKWGSWGVLEYVNQTSSPKYDALVEWLHRSATSKTTQ